MIRATNINQTLRTLKDIGHFVYGFDERDETTYDAAALNSPTISDIRTRQSMENTNAPNEPTLNAQDRIST